MRRVFSRGLVAAAAASTLLLAACGGGDNSSNNAGGGGGSNAACGKSIGFFGALTGSAANLGINIKDGAKLAVDQYNTANPNCKVTLKEFDSEGSEDKAPQVEPPRRGRFAQCHRPARHDGRAKERAVPPRRRNCGPR